MKKINILVSYQIVSDAVLIHCLKLFSSNLKGKSVSKALEKPKSPILSSADYQPLFRNEFSTWTAGTPAT